MTAATPSDASSDTTAVEFHGRWQLIYLLASAGCWLVLSGILALFAGIQLHAPGFLADCPVFTHGRCVALAETAFVYGWLAQAGLALALWVLARLGGEPLRAATWTMVGTTFWNAALLLGMIGIAIGDGTAIPLMQLPAQIQFFLLIAYGAIAVAGVLAWSGRQRRPMFASQWYAVAALFLFPWVSSVAQVMLFWHPARGTLQAVVAGWCGQGLWSLWLAPLALVPAFYVVPKATGLALPSYDFSILSFWCLLFIGPWTGGRHLIGGPVPAWVSTVAIVAGTTLLFHYLLTWMNLGPSLRGGSTALRFTGYGLVAYVLVGLGDAVTSFHVVAAVTQFTYFDEALRELGRSGALSMFLFGGVYYALPRLVGRSWYSAGLIRLHLGLAMVGVALTVVALGGAGIVQGSDLADPSVSFEVIFGHTAPWLLAATLGRAVFLLGNVLFLVNLFKTALCPFYAKAPWVAALRRPAAAEAPVA